MRLTEGGPVSDYLCNIHIDKLTRIEHLFMSVSTANVPFKRRNWFIERQFTRMHFAP